MEFKGKTFDSIDYFGDRCCVCDNQTTNQPEHNVFTSQFFSKTEKTGFKEYTTLERAWGFKHHPCRVCDKCKRKNYIRTGIVLSLTLVATTAYYITQWNEILQKLTWEHYVPGVIGLIAGIWVWGQIDKRFGPEAIGKKKAATIRGAGYVGWDSDDFSDIAKSIKSSDHSVSDAVEERVPEIAADSSDTNETTQEDSSVCKKCHREIESSDFTCPHCGHTQWEYIGCVGVPGLLAGAFVIYRIIAGNTSGFLFWGSVVLGVLLLGITIQSVYMAIRRPR